MLSWVTPALQPVCRFLGRVRYRVTQFLHHFDRSDLASVDGRFRALVTPDVWRLVAELAPADRAHLLAVHDWLQARGCTDPDLLQAGLLHDIGKADHRRQVGLVERIIVVLARRLAPALLPRLARPNSAIPWRHGLYLALEHPRLGADRARRAGCNERVCWLIAHHHGPDQGDPALRLLQRADEEG